MTYSESIIEAVKSIRAQANPVNLFDRGTLLANLIFIQQVIIATEDLLLSTSHLIQGDDSYKAYLLEHLEEECGHAQWLQEDLASAGVTSWSKSKTAIAMAGSIYYMTRNVNPECLLGYMLVLEAFPMPESLVTDLEAVHGKELMRTVRHHALHDPDHSKDLCRIIDGRNSPEIMESAIQTAIYLNEFSKELV